MTNSTITPENFTRVNSGVSGNPRYAIHFLNIADNYERAIKLANKLGGRKYHTKSYGGGIVFQSYNIQNTCDKLNELLNSIKTS